MLVCKIKSLDETANYIKNIIYKSHKLKIRGKIACLTPCYNISKLCSLIKIPNDILDITTFNNFLYCNVIRPYNHLITANINMFPKSCGVDDTLVASEILFSNYPNLYNLIKAKYPYILVVGFEDLIATADHILNKLKEIGIAVQVVKHHN